MLAPGRRNKVAASRLSPVYVEIRCAACAATAHIHSLAVAVYCAVLFLQARVSALGSKIVADHFLLLV
jgi:hypothetical protein